MDRVFAAQVTPRLLSGEDEDRSEPLTERFENLAHRGLRGPSSRGIDRVAIHSVLRDVDIEATQVNGAKLIESVINLVEFVRRIGGPALFDHALQAIENPAIDQSGGTCFCRWRTLGGAPLRGYEIM